MSSHAFVKNRRGLYEVTGAVQPEEIICLATEILCERMSQQDVLTNPTDVARFLQLKLGAEEFENFSVILLDSKHRIITYQKLFTGTLDAAAIYPRVIAKSALTFSAAAVILAHNHPSNDCEPSEADQHITRQVKKALALVDIRVLDHFIVSHAGWVSFTERSLL